MKSLQPNLLLFIEPTVNEKTEANNDEITDLLEVALSDLLTKHGTGLHTNEFMEGSSYRGFHVADDGTFSGSTDILLPNGMITHSLCVHYARYYRDSFDAGHYAQILHLANFIDPESVDKIKELIPEDKLEQAIHDFNMLQEPDITERFGLISSTIRVFD